jgi:hypothetical protein
MEDNAFIKNNTGNYPSGGVYIADNTSAFTMSGGTISGNKTTTTTAERGYGGGVSLKGSTSVFSKTGGIIYGNEDGIDASLRNTAYSNGHAVYVFFSSGPFFILSWGLIPPPLCGGALHWRACYPAPGA